MDAARDNRRGHRNATTERLLVHRNAAALSAWVAGPRLLHSASSCVDRGSGPPKASNGDDQEGQRAFPPWTWAASFTQAPLTAVRELPLTQAAAAQSLAGAFR